MPYFIASFDEMIDPVDRVLDAFALTLAKSRLSLPQLTCIQTVKCELNEWATKRVKPRLDH